MMDPHKKTALIKWLDALSDKKIETFNDIRDGMSLITILKSFDDHFIPSDTSVDTIQQRFEAVRTYLENFYHQSLSDNKLINFDILIQYDLHGHIYDWEMGRLLLALLGALIQDKYREQFVQPAFTMEERSQMELKAMIESVLFMNDTDTNLPVGFDDVLKRKIDASVDHGAALFLKLVADGMSASPKVVHSTPRAGKPQTNDLGPVCRIYSNSPGGAASPGMSIRDISSPLRVMSLNSPVSPLGALMQSPQLAQKALLRQKIQEIKRLELALQNEQHLRSELELDLEERGNMMKDKDNRLRELERQMGDMRALRDQLDELEVIKADREKLSKDNARLQARLTECQNLRDHCHTLELENKEALAEVEKTRKDQKEIVDLKRSSEEFRREYHRLQILVKEHEAEIQHREQETKQLNEALVEAKNMYSVSQQHVSTLKQDKEELEELLGTRNGMIGIGGLGHPGESMSVVIEKRLSELQEEYDKVKSTWIDPEEFNKIKKQCEEDSQAKQTLEEKYFALTKKLLSTEDEVAKLSSNVTQYQSSMSQLETSLEEERSHSKTLQSQLEAVTENEVSLRKSEFELQSTNHELEERVQSLEKQLSQCQTELKLTQREVEVQLEANETRRLTMVELDKEKLEKTLAEQRLNFELNSWKAKAEKSLQQVIVLKKESADTEDKLKNKIQELQEMEKQLASESEQLSSEISMWKAKAEESRQKLYSLQMETDNKIKALHNTELQLSSELAESKAKVQKLELSNDEISSELNQWKATTAENLEQLNKLKSESSTQLKAMHKNEKVLKTEVNMWMVKVEETTQQLKSKTNEVNIKEEVLAAKTQMFHQIEQQLSSELHELSSELKSWKAKAETNRSDCYRVKAELTDEITRLQQSEEQLSAQLKFWQAKVDEGKEQIKNLKSESAATEEKLKSRIQNLQGSIIDKETEVGSMRIENENLIKTLRDKNSELESDLKESQEKWDSERKSFTEKYEQLEAKFNIEKNLNEERAEQIESLTRDFKDYKASSVSKEESLMSEITTVSTEKKALELDVHKARLELQSATESFNSKIQKHDMKLKDYEETSKQDIDRLKQSLEQQYTVEKNLKIEISNLNKVFESQKQDIEKLNKVIEKLRSSNDKISDELKMSKMSVVDLQLKVKNVNEVYETESEQNVLLQNKKDAIIGELENKLEKAANEHSSERDALTEKIHLLEQTISQKTTDYADVKDMLLEDIKTVKAEHIKELTKLDEIHVEALSKKNEELYTAKKDLTEMKQALETKILNLEQTVNEKDQSTEQLRLEYNRSVQEKDKEINDLFSQLNTCNAEATSQKSKHESDLLEFTKLKTETENELKSVKDGAQSEVDSLRNKLVETEHYWRSQCEQLEEEYNNGTTEQKEEYENQVAKITAEFEEKIQQLSDEKDMFIANQQQAYCERISGLEKVIGEKKEEILCVLKEKENLKMDFDSERVCVEKQVEDINLELAEEVRSHKESCDKLESLKQQIVSLEESKKAEIEILTGQYETQLETLRENLGCKSKELVAKLTEQHKAEIDRLSTENGEQKNLYQGMISDLEEKLDSETSDLKERLSQMKCQYEAIIETNKKENRSQTRDTEKKLTEASDKIVNLETELSKQCETVASLQNQCSSCASLNTELQETVTKLQTDKSELDLKMLNLEEQVNSLNNELDSRDSDLKGAKEEVLRERGEREEVERQLSYLRDQNDTLSAELSSQQQQLAAVEEEKRMLEVQRSQLHESHSSLQDLRVQAENDLKFINIEKLELERQLQSSQKCYEAVKKSEQELESQLEKLQQEKTQTEARLRELEQRVFSYMEREKKITQDNQHQVDKAAELNGTLRRQLDEKCRELSDLNTKFSKEVENMQEQFTRMKETYEKDIRQLREDKTALEIEVASLDKVKEKLKETEVERKKFQDINEKYNIHYNKKKEMIVALTEELESKKKEVDELIKNQEHLMNKVSPMREKYEGELAKNKVLSNKVRSMEAQLDLAERKLREYRNQLEKSGSVFLGDNSEFLKMISSRENAADASFMENHPSSIPFNDSDEEKNVTAYHLRPRHSSLDQTKDSISDDTLTPATRASRSRKRLSKSISSVTVFSNGMTPGAASIGSASSLAYRLRSRESAASLNRSITSTDSCRSNASVPKKIWLVISYENCQACGWSGDVKVSCILCHRCAQLILAYSWARPAILVAGGTGGLYLCEDEPMEFEWGRLGELQRRNTLCPAHLKTAYPVETQMYKPNKFRDDALRESTMGNVTLQTMEHGSGRKRKHQRDDSSADSSDNKSKLAKAGTVYQKPGPPTPANSRRNSGKGTSKSPSSRRNSGKGSKSPRTPVSLRGRHTPSRRTPKFTPKTSSVVSNLENTGSGKKSSKRESVAFSIGFSPLSNKKQLRRQQGFIQKQPQSSSQTRKPLGVRNFLQTGV